MRRRFTLLVALSVAQLAGSARVTRRAFALPAAAGLFAAKRATAEDVTTLTADEASLRIADLQKEMAMLQQRASTVATAEPAATAESVAITDPIAAAPEDVRPPPTPETPPAPPAPPLTSAFDFDVPFRGEPREITPFIGKANLVVNVKFDDPVSIEQMPGITSLLERFESSGLHVLAFPTDQGWFEGVDSNTLRLMFKSTYDFGQYPKAVVFDKADLLGTNALPLYSWLTAAFPNPWGVNRIVFNYEKFLLDANGQPLRRYPRKFPISLIEADVDAVLNGRPLPEPSARLVQAWEAAKREAIKSEYAFKPGLNYYKKGSPAS